MSNETDPNEMLLQRATEGDAAAWRELVETWSGRVYGLLLRQCGEPELAEELVQETFVKFVQSLRRKGVGGYESRGQFQAWLFRIAINALRDEKRRQKRHAISMDMSPAASAGATGTDESMAFARVESKGAIGKDTESNPLECASRQEQVVALRKAISDLSESDQQILHLRHTAGLSFGEIAETLEQPLGTVLARGHRALAKLREKLAFLQVEEGI